MNKTLIIGIDSATFDVIKPMMKEGRLPNLASIAEGGTCAPLTSTVPPVTPPAWVSFMTGKNPGKHGVFDFFGATSKGYIRPLFNSNYIKAKTLWKILSDHGMKLGVVNLPMTHPPEKINGFVVPGVQYSFDSEEGFTHPPELFEEIKSKAGDYRVIFGDLESLYTTRLDRFLEEWRDILEVRKKAFLHLMETKEWDLFMGVFYAIDSIQHHFWKFFDKSHPLYDEKLAQKYKDIIPEFYERIDEAMGEMLEKAGPDVTVMVVSDHGAGAEKDAFYLNNWLANEGLLTYKKSLAPFRKIRFPHLFYKALRRLGIPLVSWVVGLGDLPKLGKIIDPREGLVVPLFINWGKTKAYAGNHTEQGIYINLKGRETNGTVEPGEEYEILRNQIIDRLKTVKNPVTGEPIKVEVFRKEEVYSGPYVDEAPDILFNLDDGNMIAQKEIYYPGTVGRANKSSGTHRMDGIFMVKGAGIRAGHELEGANIIDAAPTLLHLLGKPVPEDMDGKVLAEAFEKGRVNDRPVDFGPPTERDHSGGDGLLGEEETEKLKKSLRDLGYFG